MSTDLILNGSSISLRLSASAGGKRNGQNVNSLAYFALASAVSFLFLPGPWELRIAIAAAGCGFLSALIRHWAFIEKITFTFLAKVVVALVAATALIVHQLQFPQAHFAACGRDELCDQYKPVRQLFLAGYRPPVRLS